MEFTEEMQWYPDYLLHIEMGDPNLNLKFQEELKGKFEETSNKKFLDINTCTLHLFFFISMRENSLQPRLCLAF